MTAPDTIMLTDAPRVRAPDGAAVDILLALEGGSMARFSLEAGETTTAAVHSTVEEIWYIIEGKGEMWRRKDGAETIVPLVPGTCLTLPVGTIFQFRAAPDEGLAAIAITMPPWPGEAEAAPAQGLWDATVT